MRPRERAHFLSHLPYNRNLYANGGWKVSPGAPDWKDFLREFFPGKIIDKARVLSRQTASCSLPFLEIWDSRYPENLRQIFDPPPVLFCQGDLSALAGECFAIVGTRNAHALALQATKMLVYDLSARQPDISIVSGLARGIDRMAHFAALEAGRPTIAVLGSGIDLAGPASNRDLIGPGMLLVSEYPPGTRPFAANFPRRNRIIAGLAGQLAVMQAPFSSGALISARFALEEGREVFAFDHDLLPENSNAGCQRLLFDGAGRIALSGRLLQAESSANSQLELFELKARGLLFWAGANSYYEKDSLRIAFQEGPDDARPETDGQKY